MAFSSKLKVILSRVLGDIIYDLRVATKSAAARICLYISTCVGIVVFSLLLSVLDVLGVDGLLMGSVFGFDCSVRSLGSTSLIGSFRLQESMVLSSTPPERA